MIGTIVTLGGGGFSMSADGSSAIDDHILGMTSGLLRPDRGRRRRPLQRAVRSRGRRTCRDRRALALLSRILGVLRPAGAPRPRRHLRRGRFDSEPARSLAPPRASLGAAVSRRERNRTGRHQRRDELLVRGVLDGLVRPARPTQGRSRPATGGACPHYLGEPFRREAYLRWVGAGALSDGYAIDDHAAIVWRDGVPAEAVSERADRPVFRIERSNDGALEHALPVRFLGGGTATRS